MLVDITRSMMKSKNILLNLFEEHDQENVTSMKQVHKKII